MKRYIAIVLLALVCSPLLAIDYKAPDLTPRLADLSGVTATTAARLQLGLANFHLITVDTAGNTTFPGYGYSNGPGYRMTANGVDTLGNVGIKWSNGAATRVWQLQLSLSNHLDFWNYNGSVWAQKFRFMDTGKLLVATSTDAGAYALQVAGDVYTTGALAPVATDTTRANLGLANHEKIVVSSPSATTLVVGQSSAAITSIGVGFNALLANSGDACTAIGLQSLYQNTGAQNTAAGVYSMQSNTGGFNSAIGHSCMFQNTGAYGAAIGHSALYQSTGNSNVAVGNSAMYKNTGAQGMAIGGNSMLQGTGDYCNGIGFNSLYQNNWPNAAQYGPRTTTTFQNDTASGKSFAQANVDGTAHTITFAGAHGFGTGKKNLLFTKTAGTTSPTGLVSGTVYQFMVTNTTTLTLAGITASGSADFVGSITNSLDITNTIALGVDVNCTKANQVIVGPTSITETLLRSGTCIGTTTVKVGYALTVGGTASDSIYCGGDVSALSITDRTDAPADLATAYAIVQSHEATADGKLNHAKLHQAAWGKKSHHRPTGRMTTKTVESREPIPEAERVGSETERSVSKAVEEAETELITEPDQSGRNLSMTVSAQAIVIKALITRIEALEHKGK